MSKPVVGVAWKNFWLNKKFDNLLTILFYFLWFEVLCRQQTLTLIQIKICPKFACCDSILWLICVLPGFGEGKSKDWRSHSLWTMSWTKGESFLTKKYWVAWAKNILTSHGLMQSASSNLEKTNTDQYCKRQCSSAQKALESNCFRKHFKKLSHVFFFLKILFECNTVRFIH